MDSEAQVSNIPISPLSGKEYDMLRHVIVAVDQLAMARQIPVNPGLHARLAMIKDVMDLPIDEEGAENDK